MAAYAALVSLMNLIDQLQHHPRPPITLDKEQVETLTDNIAFLQNFLEVYNCHYSHQEVERLRSRIADAAHAAEDVIESHIVGRIHAQSRDYFAEGAYAGEDLVESDVADQITHDEEETRSVSELKNVVNKKGKKGLVQKVKRHFGFVKKYVTKSHPQSTSTQGEEKIISVLLCQGLQKVIEDMDFVKKEVMEIKGKMGNQDLLRIITTHVVSSKSHSTGHDIMVGFDDVLNEMLDKLTGQPHSRRQIIPISGMGGIGKTTLARNLYINPLIEYRFDIRAWITISQAYNIREILLGVLLSQKNQGSRESMSQMSNPELGERLYKSLYGRRYLIVMDDMWNVEAWDEVKFFLPNESNGSRIIVTTRLPNVASYLTSCFGLEMNFLDQDKSWSLFCKTVFGEEDCPPELKHIGMEIAQNCKGLPLSIVVIGGLLAKSELTQAYWEYIAKNLNSIVNLEENERCLKMLYTSYYELPAHLKACFLYMGIFPGDRKIHVTELIRMWVAERFLKPICGKCFEEIAEEYLMDLINRNLILVDEHGSSGYIKFCKIHDLLRDLCLREARKEKFICAANQYSEGLNTKRRITIHKDTSRKEYHDSLKGGSVTRSLICYSEEVLPLVELRLLRVFQGVITDHDGGDYRWEHIFRLVNLRCLVLSYYNYDKYKLSVILPSFISLIWNLHTLWLRVEPGVFAPPEIWNMPLLRHIESNSLSLPGPPSCHTERRDDCVLHNLHTCCGISNLQLGEEVVKRIPNVKKLGLWYRGASNHCLNNLDRLNKLEDLYLLFDPNWLPSRSDLIQNLTFPHSLKKLALCQSKLYWEDISTKIGSLPLLQVLKLRNRSFRGSEWKTVEGQFCSLKYLQIQHCGDLKCWTTESTHFPCLEYLNLIYLPNLDEIPLGIGDIPTLKSIKLDYCSVSAVISAKRILEEQEELGNESIQVRVMLASWDDKRRLESLASHNFQIKHWH